MIQGYKAFDSDLTCYGGFQYEIGKTYEMKELPQCCKQGFHFCTTLSQCFNHYRFWSKTRIAKVTALGDIDERRDKICTNKIRIDEEIPWKDVLNLINIGRNNTGKGNIGCYNSGDKNIGSNNSGDGNIGDDNFGSTNIGHNNSGRFNIGDHNKGDYNNGSYNSGFSNIGYYNSGYCNIGENNSGDYNIGEYNIGTACIGAFNTKPQTIKLFNKETELTLEEWYQTPACFILKTRRTANAQEWWDSLPKKDKKVILAIPNFDAKIFEETTGINIFHIK